MFGTYEEIENTFEITVADNGYILKISAKEVGKEDSWVSDVSFIFPNLDELSTAIDARSELV